MLDPWYKLHCFSSASKSTMAKDLFLEECQLPLEDKHSPLKQPRMIGCESDQSLLGTVQHMMAENRENE